VTTTVDRKGNVTLDSTLANSGGIDPTSGRETPAYDASHGNVAVRIPFSALFELAGVDEVQGNESFRVTVQDNEFLLRLDDGDSLVIENNGGATTVTIGNGNRSVAIAEQLQTLYNNLKNGIEAWQTHTHPDGFGSTGPAAAPPVLPAWDPNIASSKLKIPNNG
jgi:hypothetical protein